MALAATLAVDQRVCVPRSEPRRSRRRLRSDRRDGRVRAAVAQRGRPAGAARSDGAGTTGGRDRRRRRAGGHHGSRHRAAGGAARPRRRWPPPVWRWCETSAGRTSLGARARQTVEAQFSHDLSGEALVGLYRDVASAGGPAQRLSAVALLCAPVHAAAARVSGASSRTPSSGGASVGCGGRPRRSRRRCDRPAAC